MRKIIQNREYDELLLSSISIWEFSKLTEKKRLTLVGDGWVWIKEALLIPDLSVVDLTPEISAGTRRNCLDPFTKTRPIRSSLPPRDSKTRQYCDGSS